MGLRQHIRLKQKIYQIDGLDNSVLEDSESDRDICYIKIKEHGPCMFCNEVFHTEEGIIKHLTLQT